MHTSIAKLVMAVLLAAPLSLAATSALAQAPAGKQAESNAHVLSRAELDALLAKPSQVLILDVRRPDELTNIGGFPVYLSIQAADLEKHLAYLPKDRTIVAVSNHAGRAKRAVDLLTSKGFKVAGAVGAQDYEAAGGQLTKISAPPPKSAAVK